MNDLITPVQIPKPLNRISYQDRLFFMGSCFSDYIGGKMKELRFQVCYNPFGVVYNPLSVSTNLQTLIDKELFTDGDLSYFNELWFSYAHYTLFSHPDKATCLAKINTIFKEARKFILQAHYIFITLGTSWVYHLKETGEVVANCHKQPASFFERKFLSAEQSFEALKHCIERINGVNSSARFIFTVSPIRHWKDGAVGNQRSKAALILAISKLQEWNQNIYYFPAYEIFMDELRDYRFYAADMLHPSEGAQQYIWEKFIANFLQEDNLQILRNVENIVTSLKHKPYFPETKAYQKFKRSVIDKIKDITHQYNFLDFEDLLQGLENNL